LRTPQRRRGERTESSQNWFRSCDGSSGRRLSRTYIGSTTCQATHREAAVVTIMSTNTKIEVDEPTAELLRARAAELGVTVSELVAELVTLDRDPVVVESHRIAELDRRWTKIDEGAATIPHDRVIRWLRTWGTSRFRPWQDH